MKKVLEIIKDEFSLAMALSGIKVTNIDKVLGFLTLKPGTFFHKRECGSV